MPLALTFTYPIADFIRNAQVISMMRSSSNLHQGNEGLSDEAALTLEDENILTKYLKLAANEVANAMAGYTKDLLDEDGVTALEPFEFTESVPEEGEAAEDILIFRVNMPTKSITTYVDGEPVTTQTNLFNTAYTNQLLTAIPDAIENYMLSRVTKYQALEYASYKEDFENAISKIKEYLTRRTATVVRSMNMF
jgi:hypothetical protein